MLARAQILAEHGGTGGGNGIGNNEHNRGELTADAVHRRIHQSIGIDTRRYKQHGNVNGRGLHRQRKPQIGQGLKGLPVHGETPELKVKTEALPPDIQIDHGNNEGGRLRDPRCQRRTAAFHSHCAHEYQVEDHVDNGRNGDE